MHLNSAIAIPFVYIKVQMQIPMLDSQSLRFLKFWFWLFMCASKGFVWNGVLYPPKVHGLQLSSMPFAMKTMT